VFAYYLQASRRESLDRLRSVLEAVSAADAVVVSPSRAPLGWPSSWVSLGSADPASWRTWLVAHRPSTVVVDGSEEHLRIAKKSAHKVAVVAAPGGAMAPGPAGTAYADADLVLAPWPAGGADGRPSDGPDRTLHLGAVGWAARRAVRRRRPRIMRAEDRWACVHLVPSAGGPGPRERRDLVDETPGWRWWVANESDVLCDGPTWDHLLRADVVACAPTPGNLAAVAAARIPAVLTLTDAPTSSELFLAGLAQQTAPVVVLRSPRTCEQWRLALIRARELDGAAWATWDPEPALNRLHEALSPNPPDASIPQPRAMRTGLTSV
jgi:hypothetical protein